MRPWKYIAFWLARVSSPRSVIASAVAYGMCVCRTQCASGRARQPLAPEPDRERIARAQLRPVRAGGIEQEAIAPARHGEAEVVVDALVEAVEGGGAQRGRELDAGYAESGSICGDIDRSAHRAMVTASGNP